jgi:hypothetical protein
MKEKELDQIWVIDKDWKLEKWSPKTETIETLWVKPDFDAAERTIDASQLW